MAFFHSMNQDGKIQELYDRCRMVFCGYEGLPPILDEIRWLQDLLGTMGAVDVGIDGSDEDSDDDDDDNEKLSSRGLISGCKLEELTYIHIHECEEFSIGVFCFPAGAKLPLHDHPGMVVLSKVLYGSVLVRAYDWVKAPEPNYKNCSLARLVLDDQVMEATSPASVLFPTSRNMHSFTALTPCAILDVLSPPYSEEHGRPSTYFSEIPIPSLDGFVILKEMGVPEHLVLAGAPYLGPELVVDEEELDTEAEDDCEVADGQERDGYCY